MPFESFETDEKLQRPPRKGPDLDTIMLFGCSGFVIVALASWALVVWPHFLFTATYELGTIKTCAVLGLVPAAVFGAIVTRIFGLPAAAGFLGGSICAATFMYLRLQQVFAFEGIPEAPQPEYPSMLLWAAPLGWVLASALIIAIFLDPKEYAREPNDGKPAK